MAGLKVRNDVSLEDFRQLAKTASDGRVTRCLLALANALDGMDRAMAARLAGMDRQTLRDRVIRCNQSGLNALADAWRDGRPCRLDEGQQAALKANVLTRPGPEVDGVATWRLVDLCRIVQERFGVRAAQHDTGVALLLPSAGTAAMNLFLAELAGQVPPRAHAAAGIDNAGWHVADDLIMPADLTLLALPPYRPELNAIARVWQNLRDRDLSGCRFASAEAVVEACSQACNHLLAEPERISSIATPRWATPLNHLEN